MNIALTSDRQIAAPAGTFHFFIRVLAAGLAVAAYNLVILYAS